MLDPALVVVVAVISIVLAEFARAGMAVLLGDATPKLTHRLWHVHRNIELTGTVIVPALLALLTGVAVGWPSRVPVRDTALGRLARAAVEMTSPAAHGLFAAGSVVLPGDLGVALFSVNVLTAAFLLLPLPPLPGGGIVAALIPRLPETDSRWMRWRRGPIAPWALAVLAVLVATRVFQALADYLGITPAV